MIFKIIRLFVVFYALNVHTGNVSTFAIIISGTFITAWTAWKENYSLPGPASLNTGKS